MVTCISQLLTLVRIILYPNHAKKSSPFYEVKNEKIAIYQTLAHGQQRFTCRNFSHSSKPGLLIVQCVLCFHNYLIFKASHHFVLVLDIIIYLCI